MADFSTTTPVPNLTSLYTDVLTIINAKFTDLALGMSTTNTSPTNLPTNTIRWSDTANKWVKWNGTSLVDLATSNLYGINISGNAATATSATSATTAGNVTGTVAIANGGSGATTATAALVNFGERTSATGATKLPVGTTAQRDSTPSSGFIRFNSDTVQFEGYNGSIWTTVGGGAKGGGSNQIFYENEQTVTADYTIGASKNAMSAGPITISTGVTVTIPTGSTWTIV